MIVLEYLLLKVLKFIPFQKGLIKNNNKVVSDDEFSRSCLGHVRYKTSGNFESNTYQPIYGNNKFGKFSFVFNGNISLPKI